MSLFLLPTPFLTSGISQINSTKAVAVKSHAVPIIAPITTSSPISFAAMYAIAVALSGAIVAVVSAIDAGSGLYNIAPNTVANATPIPISHAFSVNHSPAASAVSTTNSPDSCNPSPTIVAPAKNTSPASPNASEVSFAALTTLLPIGFKTTLLALFKAFVDSSLIFLVSSFNLFAAVSTESFTIQTPFFKSFVVFSVTLTASLETFVVVSTTTSTAFVVVSTPVSTAARAPSHQSRGVRPRARRGNRARALRGARSSR